MWHACNRKGQVVKEFAVLVAVIAAALLAMQTYVKRSLQGRLRSMGDQISSRQYESPETTSQTTITRSGSSAETEHLGRYDMSSSDTAATTASQTTIEQ